MPESAGIALSCIAAEPPFFCTTVKCSTPYHSTFRTPTKHLSKGNTIINLLSSNGRPMDGVIAISYPIALCHKQYKNPYQNYDFTYDHCTAFLKGCWFNVKEKIDTAQCLFLDLTPGQVAAKLVLGKINNGIWQDSGKDAVLTVLGKADELSVEDVINKLVLPTVSNLDAVQCIGILRPEKSFPNISSWDLSFHFPDIPLMWLSVAELSYGSARIAEHYTPVSKGVEYEDGVSTTATSLCIKLADGQLVTLLPIGSTHPATGIFYLTTSKDDQTTATLQFCKDNTPCGGVMLEGLAPNSRGAVRIKVVVLFDCSRKVTVTVQEPGSLKSTKTFLGYMRTRFSFPSDPVRSFQGSKSPSFGIDGIIGELPE
jgi:hypothetical protein